MVLAGACGCMLSPLQLVIARLSYKMMCFMVTEKENIKKF